MPLEKATIVNTDTNDKLVVQFNPEEYSLNTDNAFAQAAIPGRSAPLLQFTHGNLRTLEMELIFDSYEQRTDVRPKVRQLTGLLDINPDTHAPPVLLFVWGTLRFTCVLVRANQKFILFLTDGSPARARVQVTFNEFTNSLLEAKEIKRETASFTKVYLVRRGDTLSSIANQVYADPTLWRPLAIRNAVADPRSLAPGQTLSVPPLPFRDPLTGKVFA
ncbi:MAG TPA: LysM peptidoglycan-binding domain-containing protein [Chloroflexota bacterium]